MASLGTWSKVSGVGIFLLDGGLVPRLEAKHAVTVAWAFLMYDPLEKACTTTHEEQIVSKLSGLHCCEGKGNPDIPRDVRSVRVHSTAHSWALAQPQHCVQSSYSQLEFVLFRPFQLPAFSSRDLTSLKFCMGQRLKCYVRAMSPPYQTAS